MRVILFLCGLAMLAAHASGSQVPRIERRIVHVRLSVDAWNDARVAAVLVDRTGQRTGWSKGRPTWGIRGCFYECAFEEGPVDGDPTVSSGNASKSQDTPRGTGMGTPLLHHFTVQDSARTPGLLRQGGCELRLTPDVGGKVQLILLADGVGIPECRDTMSVRVSPGALSRWWLTWKVAGDGCAVRISPMRGRRPARETAK
jgi:hypothetical protein